MTISTKNFHPDTDPKLLCTCGQPMTWIILKEMGECMQLSTESKFEN